MIIGPLVVALGLAGPRRRFRPGAVGGGLGVVGIG